MSLTQRKVSASDFNIQFKREVQEVNLPTKADDNHWQFCEYLHRWKDLIIWLRPFMGMTQKEEVRNYLAEYSYQQYNDLQIINKNGNSSNK